MTRLLNLLRVVAYQLGAYEYQRAGHLLVGARPARLTHFGPPLEDQQSRARAAQTAEPLSHRGEVDVCHE